VSPPAHATDPADAARLLTLYLRDHRAAAVGGAALARRTAAAVSGTPSGDALGEIASEVEEDERALDAWMRALGVRRSPAKEAAARVGELVGRLSANGRIVRRSPLSSVLELEALAAGIDGKARLWRALTIVLGERAEVAGPPSAERLAERAASQHERVTAEHALAVGRAFSGFSR
jgi:hypothetical protein